jgi:hypothetical protein
MQLEAQRRVSGSSLQLIHHFGDSWSEETQKEDGPYMPEDRPHLRAGCDLYGQHGPLSARKSNSDDGEPGEGTL